MGRRRSSDEVTCPVDMPWGPCGKPAPHELTCPPHEPMPMCEDHWALAMALEEVLEADPEKMESFGIAVAGAELERELDK